MFFFEGYLSKMIGKQFFKKNLNRSTGIENNNKYCKLYKYYKMFD
jgi:hypothetical protein